MKTIAAFTAVLAALAAVPAVAAVPTVSVPLRHIQAMVGTPANLYVETRGDWYRAQMAKPCWALDPDTNRVRIALGADGRFDGTSTVKVHGRSCPVAFVTPGRPPLDLLLNPDG